MRNLLAVCCYLTLAPVLAHGQSRSVRYDLKLQDVKFVYGELPPVMHLKPGDTVETNTVDADGKALEAAGLKPKGPNPLTGPFYIDGAEPGDTLAVRFLHLEVKRQGRLG